MPPRHLQAVSGKPVPRLPRELRAVLAGWLARLSWEQLICRDVGHVWTAAFHPGETYTPNRLGSYDISEPCLRGCGVTRRRFIGPVTGWLDRANVMNYSRAPGYQVPEVLASWSGSRDVRGLVRLEIKRRTDEGDFPPPELLSPLRLREEASPL
jgi:hypothetical protein